MFMKEISTHLAHCDLFCVECLVFIVWCWWSAYL